MRGDLEQALNLLAKVRKDISAIEKLLKRKQLKYSPSILAALMSIQYTVLTARSILDRFWKEDD